MLKFFVAAFIILLLLVFSGLAAGANYITYLILMLVIPQDYEMIVRIVMIVSTVISVIPLFVITYIRYIREGRFSQMTDSRKKRVS